MDDENPLQVSPIRSPVANNKIYNKSGRPTIKNMVKFGPQPKSIIAQMLSEKKIQENINVKEDIICLDDDQSDDSSVVDKSDDYICSLESNNQAELQNHQAKHKEFSCDFPNCTYSCKLSSNLRKHKRVHTNEKPYLCEKCCFRSNFVNSLKAHKRTHTAERPYQCEHCSYKCNSSSNLKKHCRHRHPLICQCVKN